MPRLIPALAAVLLSWPVAAFAHFQTLLPDTDILPDDGDRTVTLSAVFTHPMEGGPVMAMDRPARFGVLAGKKKTDLSALLSEKSVDGKPAFEARYTVPGPGDYVFYLAPAPYWDAAEKQYLIHYTKVVVDYGGGEDWDALAGLPVEIQPLTRPYGLWTGSLFRGVALKDGKPLPHARVEIEWLNDGSVTAPSDPFITQEVKTDSTGVFAYAMPRAGWWGFNVLTEGKVKDKNGKPAEAELGGTMWVHTTDFK